MDEKKIKIDAYAKINLHLDITEIRDDGYHNIQSIMQSISLCDIVEIELITEKKIIIQCDTDGVPLDERNIAYKAASRFFDKAGIDCGVRIEIEKNIPMAAGLAGGSADGAAVLVGLNKLFKNTLTEKELLSLGASLGADIPFCMICGCCITTGIGDKLVPIEPLNDKNVLVIACGGERVSTPAAYSLLDNKYNRFIDYAPKDYDALKNTISKENSDFYKYLFNVFEEPISKERPAVATAKSIMINNGAKAAMMSGSGPSVFGIFDDINKAQIVVEALKTQGYFATVAFPNQKRKL